MRLIRLFAMCVLLEACIMVPMFPPEVMKDVETNTFDVKAWQEQVYRPSNVDFVPRKVALGGEIIQVIRKPEGVVLLVEEQPIENHSTYGSKNVEREESFWYPIAFNGSLERDILQRSNKLVVVGMTDKADTQMIGGAPKVLPHLLAECLHIWNVRDAAPANFSCYGGPMGHHPAKERTFCLEDDSVKSLPISEPQGDEPGHSEGL
ncbi:MAG TPA: Slp family lipoprotein [Nitrospira sp.]|nr:Slp family lipoprotein [Nitrospira sp.]